MSTANSGAGDLHLCAPTPALDVQVDRKYELIKPIGQGAYGVVISALDTENGQKVAIKKITRAFDDLVDAKRILREITLLRKFSHDNVSVLPLVF